MMGDSSPAAGTPNPHTHTKLPSFPRRGAPRQRGGVVQMGSIVQSLPAMPLACGLAASACSAEAVPPEAGRQSGRETKYAQNIPGLSQNRPVTPSPLTHSQNPHTLHLNM